MLSQGISAGEGAGGGGGGGGELLPMAHNSCAAFSGSGTGGATLHSHIAV